MPATEAQCELAFARCRMETQRRDGDVDAESATCFPTKCLCSTWKIANKLDVSYP